MDDKTKVQGGSAGRDACRVAHGCLVFLLGCLCVTTEKPKFSLKNIKKMLRGLIVREDRHSKPGIICRMHFVAPACKCLWTWRICVCLQAAPAVNAGPRNDKGIASVYVCRQRLLDDAGPWDDEEIVSVHACRLRCWMMRGPGTTRKLRARLTRS
jgi:hypothetical protein